VNETSPTQQRIHLVRHGEVANPRHVVYADLPGYDLSELGSEQAAATAEHLHAEPLEVVVASPLDRAVSTAEMIAKRHDLAVEVDPRLTEWRIGSSWAGIVWEDLPTQRPGELEAYLATPQSLQFAPESLDELAARVIAAIGDWADRASAFVVVSHQDPIQAARRIATGASFDRFHEHKPGHASVITLSRPDDSGPLAEVAYWEPAQGREFPPVGSQG
jgi:broad specificity phosphatase PhoE